MQGSSTGSWLFDSVIRKNTKVVHRRAAMTPEDLPGIISNSPNGRKSTLPMFQLEDIIVEESISQSTNRPESWRLSGIRDDSIRGDSDNDSQGILLYPKTC